MTELIIEPNVLQKIVSRLRKEKQESIAPNETLGFKEGFKDAQRLSYKCLEKVILGYSPSHPEYNAKKHIESIEHEYYGDLYDTICHEHRETLEVYITDEELYFKGWVEGVMHFWNQVKDQL